MHEENTDFLCQHQQWENEIPYRNIHFCSTFDAKPFRVTQGLYYIDASISCSSIIKKKKQNKTKTNKQTKQNKNQKQNKNKKQTNKNKTKQKTIFQEGVDNLEIAHKTC